MAVARGRPSGHANEDLGSLQTLLYTILAVLTRAEKGDER
jgi:hypothetical protein